MPLLSVPYSLFPIDPALMGNPVEPPLVAETNATNIISPFQAHLPPALNTNNVFRSPEALGIFPASTHSLSAAQINYDNNSSAASNTGPPPPINSSQPFGSREAYEIHLSVMYGSHVFHS
jgi:hypothetical protein